VELTAEEAVTAPRVRSRDARAMSASPSPFDVPLSFAATHGDGAKETLALRRGASAGVLVRLHRGVYAPSVLVAELDERGRHVLLCRAVAPGLGSRCVVSHASAGAVWALPRVGLLPEIVHVVDPRRETARRSAHLFRRPGDVVGDETERVGDLVVTSLVRTATDIALTGRFGDAVLCLDAVLRRLVLPDGHDQGLEVSARLEKWRAILGGGLGPPGRRGGTAGRRALAFASPWAENGGESLLRLALHDLGVGRVSLQRVVCVDRREVGRVDTFLDEHGTAVELDGFVKLTDPGMLAGRTPAEAARRQNRRDQRLLGVPEIRRVVHCEYADIVHPERLASHLRRAGVPLDPRRVTLAVRTAARRFAARA
jgi:hypothetical protein